MRNDKGQSVILSVKQNLGGEEKNSDGQDIKYEKGCHRF